jgi:hypothetical protein
MPFTFQGALSAMGVLVTNMVGPAKTSRSSAAVSATQYEIASCFLELS